MRVKLHAARNGPMHVNRKYRRMDAPRTDRDKTPENPVPPATAISDPERLFFSGPGRRPRLRLKTARSAIWCWDIASNRITWSTNLEDIHGLPRGSFDGTFAAFENDIHPDDRAEVLASIQEALRTRSRIACSTACRRGRISEERWIEVVGTVMVEERRAGAPGRHLPRRHRTREAAPRVARRAPASRRRSRGSASGR